MSPKISFARPADGGDQEKKPEVTVDTIDDTRSEDGAPSQREIVKQYRARSGKSQFNFEERILAVHMKGESAAALIPSGKASEWTEPPYEITRENVLEAAIAGMPAHWSQANRNNELGALKGQQELVAYAFLAGDGDFADELRRMKLDYCGKAVLVAWCERYGVEWSEYDNDEWVDKDGTVSASEALGAE